MFAEGHGVVQDPSARIRDDEGIPVHQISLVEIVAEESFVGFGGNVEFELNPQRGGGVGLERLRQSQREALVVERVGGQHNIILKNCQQGKCSAVAVGLDG